MAKQRITEDFVKHFEKVKTLTGDNPSNLWRALDADPSLPASIRQLDTLWHLIERHRQHSSNRFIVQAYPGFSSAARSYRERWAGALFDLWDWEAKKEGRETIAEYLEHVIEDLPSRTNSSQPDFDDDDWDFDPDTHSAASHIDLLVDYLESRSDDEPFFARSKGAIVWLKNTAGLDFGVMETRFKEFPVIAMPKHVSDKHGIADRQSLFSYLTDVRRAYMIDALQAALAMCRTCTEILMRRHYNEDENTPLGRLIDCTLKKSEFAHLRTLNLDAKVREANRILHDNKQDIQTHERVSELIRQWVRVLAELIDKVPPNPRPS